MELTIVRGDGLLAHEAILLCRTCYISEAPEGINVTRFSEKAIVAGVLRERELERASSGGGGVEREG